MVERMNSDLANVLGNLVNRTISMTNKYFGGIVTDKGITEEVDAELKAVVERTPGAVDEKMDKLRVADAITEIFNLFKRCNKYIDETMPWVLAKDEAQKDRLETVLYNLIDSISKGAELLSSFMPETAEKILAQLNGGNVTDKPEILFQRLDLEEVIKKVEELHPPVEEEKEEEGIDIEAKEEITHTLRAYLHKDAMGSYTFPLVRQRPILLIGPPGIGKTAVMEQIARECQVGLSAIR